jgi:hypothetical protein
LPALAKVAPDLGVTVADRTVTLTGTVPSAQVRESLAKQVQDAAGADVTVANQLQIAEQTPPQLRVKVTPDAVQLSGTVAQSTADKAVQVAGTVSGSVVNQLTIGETTAQPAWLPTLLETLPTFAKNVQEAELNVDGSTITLIGALESDEQKTITEATVRQAVGADPTIVNQLRVVAPVAEVQPSLNIKVAENTLTLSGNVAQDTATQLTQALTLPDVTLANQLTTADNVAQPEWLPEIIGLFPDYSAEVEQAELDVKDSKLTLAGTVPSAEKKTEVAETFASAAGEGVEVVNNLQVEAAEPVALRVTIENGVATVAGNLPAETAEGVVASVDETPDTTVTNEIQAASSVTIPDWFDNVTNLLPAVTSEVKDADVVIAGDTITLAGVVPSEEKKTELAASVSEAAGEDVEVVNNLVVEAPAQVEPVQLRVQLQDGAATVTGNVPAATAAQITEVVEAAPETASVSNAVEAAPNVQVPEWLPTVVEVLPEATRDIADADVNIVADTITLAGTVPSEERKAEVAMMIEEAAGAEVRVVNNLTVVPEVAAQVSEAETQETVTEEVSPEETAPEETPVAAEGTAEEIVEVAPPEVAPANETRADETRADETRADETRADETRAEAQVQPEETRAEQETPVVAAPTRNPDVRVDIAGNTIRLTGTVPSPESVTAAAAPYSTETVENLLEPTPDVASVPWLNKLYEVAPKVAADLNRATLVLNDTTLTLQGTAPSLEQRDAIGKYVSDALSPEVTVINRLTVQVQIPNAEDGK